MRILQGRTNICKRFRAGRCLRVCVSMCACVSPQRVAWVFVEPLLLKDVTVLGRRITAETMSSGDFASPASEVEAMTP